MTSDRAISLIAAGLACAIAVAVLAGWRAHTQAKHRFAREGFSERSAAAPAPKSTPWVPRAGVAITLTPTETSR